jgi:peptidoglycan/LPS O-acetylase OafA/YrhL
MTSHQAHLSPPKYRPDIDGLRALAVLPVILFHAGFETFSGGFVGVDVFFVISGYLITTIILAELEQGKFSIVNFYERRARRILPALFLVMLVCIPFAWFSLLPSDMKDFSQSLVAVSVFASNILFWHESDYFDAAAELKPLLHTWSLAVEEQYYVLFPLFLMLFWQLGKRWILVTLGIVFVASLAAAQWAAYAKPAAAFFFLPTRIWELLIGAFAAFYMSKANRKELGKVAGEVGGWLGVALILYAVFSYSKATPFPGLYALVPSLGTVLVILFATQQTTVGKFVGNKAFVGAGLISYSAYLWHQPLFAFARQISLTEPSHTVFLVLSVLASVLAYFSWRYVEVPFRKSGFISREKIFFLAFCFLTFFFIFGYFGHSKNGIATRFETSLSGDIGHKDFFKLLNETYKDCEAKDVAESSSSWEGVLRCKQSKTGTPDIILLGDSHAEHLIVGLAENLPNKNVAFYIQGRKPYLETKEFSPIFEEILRNGKRQHIILTMYFIGHLDSNASGLYDEFSRTIKALLDVKKSVTLVGNVPRFNRHSEHCIFYSSNRSEGNCLLSREEAIRQRLVYEDILKRLASDFGLDYVRIDEILCLENFCSMSKDGAVLYRDANHLNIIGSKLVGKYLAERLPLN